MAFGRAFVGLLLLHELGHCVTMAYLKLYGCLVSRMSVMYSKHCTSEYTVLMSCITSQTYKLAVLASQLVDLERQRCLSGRCCI